MGSEQDDERPWTERAGESIKAGAESAMRTVSRGVAQLPWEDAIDEQNPGPELGGQDGFFGAGAKQRASAHPFANMVGQVAAQAPLALSPGGVVAGVLGEATAGGYAAEAEQAWQQDRDFSQEAAFQNVGMGVLLGGAAAGVAKVAGGVAQKLGRNLFTEAEHAAHARSARDLLGDITPTGDSAAEIARRGPDDEGVRYLRDNHDSLLDDLATQHSRAAQQLLDTYGSLAPLRQTAEQVAEHIPNNPIDQARWVTQAKREVGAALDELDPAVAAPLHERLATLSDGDDPAQWFTRASELSDELLRARSKAAPVEAAADELLPDEIKALNAGKSSLGFLARPNSKLAGALESGLEKVTVDDPGTLYRGMRLTPDQLSGIVENGYHLDKHTMSSVSREAAQKFASGVDRKTPVLMQLEGTPRAAMAHGFPGDEFPAEESAILFPGSRYSVAHMEDVMIPGEKDWMQPEKGKLLTLRAEGSK